MGNYFGFTRGQSDYLRRSLFCWLNVAEGGKRAGKNVLNVLAFAMCVENHADKIHLAAGVTAAAARMNILDCNGLGLLDFFRGRCREGKYEGKQALFVDGAGGEKVIIVEGGGKANDAARIKGHSFGSVYISEANEVHRGFFFEVLDRTLASTTRKLFFDLNPKMPAHWFYKDFLDRQESLEKRGENSFYNYGHFTIFDNLSVSEEKLREAMKGYDRSSRWFLADILGKRTAGENSIYTGFSERLLVGADRIAEMRFTKFSVGVDVGGTDATVATLVGITDRNEVVLVDGYYHRQGNGRGYTHDRYAEEIALCMEAWGKRFAGVFFGASVFCESADKLFRQALGNALRGKGLGMTVYPSYKKDGILDRIRLFCLLMNQERLFVCDGMGEWIEAFFEAEWDEKARSAGEWVRRDDGSCPIDCLDSAEYGVVPFKKILLEVR